MARAFQDSVDLQYDETLRGVRALLRNRRHVQNRLDETDRRIELIVNQVINVTTRLNKLDGWEVSETNTGAATGTPSSVATEDRRLGGAVGDIETRLAALLDTVQELKCMLQALTCSPTVFIDEQIRRADNIACRALLRIESPDGTIYGAGFFISEDGFVLTASHIGRQGFGRCTAWDTSENKYECEPVSVNLGSDVSLLRIARCDGPHLLPADDFNIADSVCIGAGLQDNSRKCTPNITDGRISEYREDFEGRVAMFQLSTTNNNAGMSGGPVLELSSDLFIGLVAGIDRSRPSDQGQSYFALVTKGSAVWGSIEEAMIMYRES